MAASGKSLLTLTFFIRDHEKHNVMDVDRAGETQKVRVRALVDSVRNRIPGLEQYIQFVDGYQDYILDMTSKVSYG